MGAEAAGESQRRVVTKGASVIYKAEDAHGDHPGSGPEWAAVVSRLHRDRDDRCVDLTVFCPNTPAGTFNVINVPFDPDYPERQSPGERQPEQKPDTWRFPGGFEEVL